MCGWFHTRGTVELEDIGQDWDVFPLLVLWAFFAMGFFPDAAVCAQGSVYFCFHVPKTIPRI